MEGATGLQFETRGWCGKGMAWKPSPVLENAWRFDRLVPTIGSSQDPQIPSRLATDRNGRLC